MDIDRKHISAGAVDSYDFKAAMRQLASGVAIITTTYRSTWAGLTVTSLCSVSIAPPTILVCVDRDAVANRLIREGLNFCVSILDHSQQAAADTFAGRTNQSMKQRFLSFQWITLFTGAPALADSLAIFDCRAVGTTETATHSVFFGEVMMTRHRDDGKALLHCLGTYNTLSRV